MHGADCWKRSTAWERPTKSSSESAELWISAARRMRADRGRRRRGKHDAGSSPVLTLRSQREIALMRQAGLAVWEAHQIAAGVVKPGATTGEIDAAIEAYFNKIGAVPLFKGVPGKVPFPAVTCISVNEEVVHGIPGPRKLKEGDVVSIDTG